MGHENGQDRFHAVIRETLGRFVADDVGNTRRHTGKIRRRCQVFVVSHKNQGVGVVSGKNSTGVGEAFSTGAADPSSTGLDFSSPPLVSPMFSFCASGSSPKRCFSHEQQRMTAAAEIEATICR